MNAARAALVVVLTTMLLDVAPALGACVSGKPATYSDINAVMFQRTAGGWVNPANPPLKGSAYWVFFWNIEPGATYSQFSKRSDRGTYHLTASLGEAIEILERDHFFTLNPGEHLVTDVGENVVTVRRCGVVTRLMMFDVPEFDAKVNKLFSDFDLLVERSSKKKTDDDPEEFKYSLLFGVQ